MAHFAELDDNNIVMRVVVVGNDIPTANGPLGENDKHPDGESWCKKFFRGGNWKQCSYNNNFRKQYPGRNHIYDPNKDVFIVPQPFPSWVLDSNSDWQAPVAIPDNSTLPTEEIEGTEGSSAWRLLWDEENLRWTCRNGAKTQLKRWDPDSSTWIDI